jgi:large subunit ribosomal protein L3
VLDVSNNRVTQIKTAETDGYGRAGAFGPPRFARDQAAGGHLAKAGVEAGEILKEFRSTRPRLPSCRMAPWSVWIFSKCQKVDVQGVSIGKGYAGTIKRHNFASGRATHGNSRSHNVPGSIGMAQDPGRVFPGKRMTGHMGDVTVTVQNLEIARRRRAQAAAGQGCVPGAKGGKVSCAGRQGQGAK